MALPAQTRHGSLDSLDGGSSGRFTPRPRVGRAREFKARFAAAPRTEAREYTRSPQDQEVDLDDRTTLTDDELTGAFSTRAEVADSDQDDPDTDSDDSDADDSDSDDADADDADDSDS